MGMKFHLINNNAGLFREPTLQISTVEILPGEYETAYVTNGGVEPIASYETMQAAIDGHYALSRRYGLTNQVAV